MITNMFAALDKKELREIYDAIAVSREEGMRPRILDEYIRQVREVYLLSVGEAWKYTEQLHTALAGGSWCGTERQRGGGSGSVLM